MNYAKAAISPSSDPQLGSPISATSSNDSLNPSVTVRTCPERLIGIQNCNTVFKSAASTDKPFGIFCKLHRTCFGKDLQGRRCNQPRFPVPSEPNGYGRFCNTLHISRRCLTLRGAKRSACINLTDCSPPPSAAFPDFKSYRQRKAEFNACAEARQLFSDKCVYSEVADVGHKIAIDIVRDKAATCKEYEEQTTPADVLAKNQSRKRGNRNPQFGGYRTRSRSRTRSKKRPRERQSRSTRRRRTRLSKRR